MMLLVDRNRLVQSWWFDDDEFGEEKGEIEEYEFLTETNPLWVTEDDFKEHGLFDL